VVVNFEQELRDALRREPPPPDFAARVLARVPRKEVIVLPVWRRPLAWALAAGLAVALLAPPAAMEYRRREQARAIEARRQLYQALAITRVKLQESRERIQRATSLRRGARHQL